MEAGPGTGSVAKQMATKRRELRKRNQQNRRYPFKKTTKIIELVDSRFHSRLKVMLAKLRPYLLKNEEPNNIQLHRLYFDLEEIEGRRKYIIAIIASFLKEAKEGLLYKQSVFFRYLSTPEHCNLGIKETSLKALILSALQEID